jgi:hypothetical protein
MGHPCEPIEKQGVFNDREVSWSSPKPVANPLWVGLQPQAIAFEFPNKPLEDRGNMSTQLSSDQIKAGMQVLWSLSNGLCGIHCEVVEPPKDVFGIGRLYAKLVFGSGRIEWLPADRIFSSKREPTVSEMIASAESLIERYLLGDFEPEDAISLLTSMSKFLKREYK